MYLQLPVYLVYNFHEDSRQIKPPLFYTRILIRLEHLLNLFFLERLLSDKSKSIGGRDLLTISFEMLSLTTILWTHKDRLAGFQGEFEWLVSCLPSAHNHDLFIIVLYRISIMNRATLC